MPPVTKLQNPINGALQTSKVVHYGLEEEAIRLRKAGLSLKDISQALNEKIAEHGQNISIMAVSRYFSKKAKEDDDLDIDLRENEEKVLNIYGEFHKMYRSLCSDLDLIELSMHEINGEYSKKGSSITARELGKEVERLSYLKEKTIARLQSLLIEMGKVQEKVYQYIRYITVIRKTFDTMKEVNPVVYAEVFTRLNSDPYFPEMLKQIEDFEKVKKERK